MKPRWHGQLWQWGSRGRGPGLLGLLLGALLGLPGEAGAQSARAVARQGGITVWAKPGAVTATAPGGAVLWRKAVPDRRTVRLDLKTTDRELLLLSSDGARRSLLAAYGLRTGELLWEYRSFDSVDGEVQLRGVAGSTVLLTVAWGARPFRRTIGIALDTGQTRFKVSGGLVGFTRTEAVLLDYGTASFTPPNATWLPLVRLNLTTGERSYVGVLIPSRDGCGAIETRTGGPDLRFDNRSITALRREHR